MQKNIKIPKDLIALSELLDSKFKGPFGFKFGLDSIIGLVPVFGDLITSLISLYIVVRCALLGVSKFVILKMFFNIGVEYLIGLVPFLGNIFDFFWKANDKNMALLRKYEMQSSKTSGFAAIQIFFIIALSLLVIATFVTLAFYIFSALLNVLMN